MISFTIPFEPVAKGRPRFARVGNAVMTYTPARTRAFETAVKLYAQQFKPLAPLTGPLLLQIDFFMRKPQKPKDKYPITRPDLDNLIKPIKDALNKIFWIDDSQIVRLVSAKDYGTPAIAVTITQL